VLGLAWKKLRRGQTGLCANDVCRGRNEHDSFQVKRFTVGNLCGNTSLGLHVCNLRATQPDHDVHETYVGGVSYFWASCGRSECVSTDSYHQKRVAHSVQCVRDAQRISQHRFGAPAGFMMRDAVGEVRRG
jgi:hypothetical protein